MQLFTLDSVLNWHAATAAKVERVDSGAPKPKKKPTASSAATGPTTGFAISSDDDEELAAAIAQSMLHD